MGFLQVGALCLEIATRSHRIIGRDYDMGRVGTAYAITHFRALGDKGLRCIRASRARPLNSHLNGFRAITSAHRNFRTLIRIACVSELRIGAHRWREAHLGRRPEYLQQFAIIHLAKGWGRINGVRAHLGVNSAGFGSQTGGYPPVAGGMVAISSLRRLPIFKIRALEGMNHLRAFLFARRYRSQRGRRAL